MFDPYHKWLGIPPSERPAHHYRLLGLALFESDPDVIDAATEQRVAYLRQCATGEHVADSQKLLNEVTTARLCLLNSEKKRDYDARLRSLQAEPPAISSVEMVKPTQAIRIREFVVRQRYPLTISGALLLVSVFLRFAWGLRGDLSTKTVPGTGDERPTVAVIANSSANQVSDSDRETSKNSPPKADEKLATSAGVRPVEVKDSSPPQPVNPETAARDKILGVWKFQVGQGQPGELTLFADGKINDPNGKNTWTLEKATLTLRWPNSAAPGGAWLDRCTLSNDGESFVGTNQVGVRLNGQKIHRDRAGSSNAYTPTAVRPSVRYEAEKAIIGGLSKLIDDPNASERRKIRRIDTPESFVEFTVQAPTTGKYRLAVRYSNGFSDRPAATHRVTVNGKSSGSMSYPPTGWWSGFSTATMVVELQAGANQIRFSKGDHFAEIDCLDVSSSEN